MTATNDESILRGVLDYGYGLTPTEQAALERAIDTLYPAPRPFSCPLCHAGIGPRGEGHSPICLWVGQPRSQWPAPVAEAVS